MLTKWEFIKWLQKYGEYISRHLKSQFFNILSQFGNKMSWNWISLSTSFLPRTEWIVIVEKNKLINMSNLSLTTFNSLTRIYRRTLPMFTSILATGLRKNGSFHHRESTDLTLCPIHFCIVSAVFLLYADATSILTRSSNKFDFTYISYKISRPIRFLQENWCLKSRSFSSLF